MILFKKKKKAACILSCNPESPILLQDSRKEAAMLENIHNKHTWVASRNSNGLRVTHSPLPAKNTGILSLPTAKWVLPRTWIWKRSLPQWASPKVSSQANTLTTASQKTQLVWDLWAPKAIGSQATYSAVNSQTGKKNTFQNLSSTWTVPLTSAPLPLTPHPSSCGALEELHKSWLISYIILVCPT